MKLRKLELNDYYKNYLNILQQLTEVGNISYIDFKNNSIN